MNTSAKYQANWIETVGGVVRTRSCGQTDRQADSSIFPLNFVCGGIIMVISAFFVSLFPQFYKARSSLPVTN